MTKTTGQQGAQKKKRSRRLPINLKALSSTSIDVGALAETAQAILVLVDTSFDRTLLSHVRDALRPETQEVQVLVRSYDEEPPAIAELGTQLSSATKITMTLILAAESTQTGAVIATARMITDAVVSISTHPTVLLPQLDPTNILDQVKNIIPLPHDSVLNTSDAFDTVEQNRLSVAHVLLDELATWAACNLGDDRVTLARAYPFMRRAVAHELAGKVAFDNALIAAVFFLPGADMPLLTFNQMKLVLQIAALYRLSLGTARIKEIAVLLAAAFASRALARFALRKVPIGAFLVRLVVAYLATRGVGRAATEFYEHQQGDFALLGKQLGEESKRLAKSVKALPKTLKATRGDKGTQHEHEGKQ